MYEDRHSRNRFTGWLKGPRKWSRLRFPVRGCPLIVGPEEETHGQRHRNRISRQQENEKRIRGAVTRLQTALLPAVDERRDLKLLQYNYQIRIRALSSQV